MMKMEMTNEIRPNTVSKSINKMTNTIGCHRKPETSITQTKHPKSITDPTNARLKSQSHRFHRERKRGRGERNLKEELLGVGVGDEVNHRSKASTHLALDLEAGGEIPMEEAVHC